jgi:hypothetical protein
VITAGQGYCPGNRNVRVTRERESSTKSKPAGSKKEELRFKKFFRNLHFTREKTRQHAHLILKPWKRGGLEDFSRTKEDEMTAATFDHQVRKSLPFFEQQ